MPDSTGLLTALVTLADAEDCCIHNEKMHNARIALLCDRCRANSPPLFLQRYCACAGCGTESDELQSWWVITFPGHAAGQLSNAAWHRPFHWHRAVFEHDEMRRLSWLAPSNGSPTATRD